MANSKLIVVEGPQGAGKTTITNYIRHKIPYTNQYRLSGSSDSSPSGKQKSVDMYVALLDYIEKLQNKNINLVFDRTFFTEVIYCRLGFKDYAYDEEFDLFLDRLASFDFDIYYITLYLSNTDEFEVRLARDGKAVNKYAHFSKASSVNQQNAYLKMADEIEKKHGDTIKVFKIDTCVGLEETEKKVLEILSNS